MDEHEKMLAEGPRVAPEPPLAELGSGLESAKPAHQPPKRKAATNLPPQFRLLRLIPLVGLGLFFLADATGHRRYAFVFLAAGFVISMLLRTRLRKR